MVIGQVKDAPDSETHKFECPIQDIGKVPSSYYIAYPFKKIEEIAMKRPVFFYQWPLWNSEVFGTEVAPLAETSSYQIFNKSQKHHWLSEWVSNMDPWHARSI